MKTLTKLALVSAMAISANAMALQSMDDEALSQATGKDGLTIHLTTGVSIDQIAIHDGDGYQELSAPVTPTQASLGLVGDSGAIVIGTAATPFTLNAFDIVIDAEGGAAPVLNVNMNLGNTTLNIGKIQVAETDYETATHNTFVVSGGVDAIDLGSITLDGLAVNIQLGNQPQGAMIKLDSTVTGGVTLSSLALNSNANAGTSSGTWGDRDSTAITLSNVNINDAGAGTNLTLALQIDPTTEGLYLHGLPNLDLTAETVDLGDGTSIGGLSVSNIQVGDIIISGH